MHNGDKNSEDAKKKLALELFEKILEEFGDEQTLQNIFNTLKNAIRYEGRFSDKYISRDGGISDETIKSFVNSVNTYISKIMLYKTEKDGEISKNEYIIASWYIFVESLDDKFKDW